MEDNKKFDRHGQNNNSLCNNGQVSDDKHKERYRTIPYNFIPFSKKTIEIKEEQMAVHDRIEDGLLTGVIYYTIEAQTPILISDGNKEKEDFTRDELGRVVIPGSTMRGLIRNNVQVLGLSSLDDDIDDYNLMYRHVASGAEQDYYGGVLGNDQINVGNGKKMNVLKNVCGGYIKNNHGSYEIYPAIEHFVKNEGDQKVYMSYYVLNEYNILRNIDDYPFFKENKQYLQYTKLKKTCKEDDGGKKIYYELDGQNKQYKPFYTEISFNVDKGGNKVNKIGEPGEFKENGFLVGTGFMNKKKVLYIIPEKDKEKHKVEIPNEDIKNFKIDFNRRKNTLKTTDKQKKGGEKIFNIPEDGEERPVFFISGIDSHIYFGFTPRLRVFYRHKIKDGYRIDKGKYDYAKSLFGTTGEKSYKSKVSFSDALLESDITHIQAVKVIQAESKPTSYMDYLKQKANVYINGKGDKKPNTYNTDDFELRGQKQYWLHKQKNELVNIKEGNGNENVGSNIYPLKSGSKFCGKVRFQNLTNDELGLLLWSIRLNENSYMNVGKAKAYGGGVIKVKNINCCLVNYEKAYNINSGLTNNPFERVDNIDKYIDEYKKAIKEKGIVIEKQPSVKAFFVMKSEFLEEKDIDIEYMNLADYKGRKALPTIELLTGEETGKERYMTKKADETAGKVVSADNSPKNKIRHKKKKVQFEENKEYEAYVKKYKDGSNIQFSVNNQIVTVRTKKVEIDGQEVNKANMPELLPLDSKCILRYENKKMIFVSRSE